MWRTVILVLVAETVAVSTNVCFKRRSQERGDDDGYYCACNAVYCDKAPDASKRPLNSSKYILITSSKSGLFFRVSRGVYKNVKPNSSKQYSVNKFDAFTGTSQMSYNKEPVRSTPLGMITVNQTDKHQEIFGFGGAVTDAAAMNIKNLSHETSEQLLGSYFGPNGIDYSFIRTPIGGSDFSTRPYTYAMVKNDTSLYHFDLAMEDYVYKIPIIKRAQELKNWQIKLLSAPWSATPWMKTNNSWTHNSKLRPEYRQLWANYFAKFFKAYRRNGLEFWGTSVQNEPESYKYVPVAVNINAMAWTPEEERDFITEYLAPTLKEENFEHIKIFTMDDTRLSLPNWPETVFQNKTARNIISGIAIHFYFDSEVDPSVLDEIKRHFPEKSMIYTEASIGALEKGKKVILGSWKRAEMYATNIIETMLHSVSAWIDWNIALNTNGGPTWINNFLDSSILVNSTANEFYKQPMFYVLGHFSKYVPPKSIRIGTISTNTDNIQNVAFSTPDGGVVLVILNLNKERKEILINDPKKGTTKINVPGKSINTMKYW